MGVEWGLVHPSPRFPEGGEDIPVMSMAQRRSGDASDLKISHGSITLTVCSNLSILPCQPLKERERC
jgi:hypothetical protein